MASNEAPPPPSTAAEEFRKNPLKTLWRRKWTVLACVLLGLIIGVVVYQTSDPVYEGAARILVSQSAPKLVQQDFAGTLATGAMWLNTQCDIIRSQRISALVLGLLDAKQSDRRRAKLAEEGELDEAEIHRQAAIEKNRQMVERMLRDHPEIEQNLIGFLQSRVNAMVGQRTEIVTVSFRGPDPDGAAALANLFCIAYRDYNDENKSSSVSTVNKSLTRLQAKADRDLTQKYDDRLQFQRQNSQFSFNREVRNPVLESVNAISQALTNSELDLTRANSEYQAVSTMLSDPAKIKQLLNNPQYRGESYALRRELRDMQAAMEGLQSTFMPGNPRMAAQQQRMERTKEEIEAEEKSIAQAILADIERRKISAQQNIDQFRIMLSSAQKEALVVNSKQADFDRIQSEIDRLEKYSEQLGEQLKSIGLAESTGTMNVYIVADAQPNSLPVEPNRLGLLFKGAGGGLVVGVLLALLLDVLDTRLRSADEIKRLVGLPILGVIPHIPGARSVTARGQIVRSEPMSDVAEAYRTVRTAIYFGVAGAQMKTLLVTSPAPGDGKTTLASNLAGAMAQAGNSVILLDCDFRKPTQHKVFEIDRKVGLSTVLAGNADIAEATQATAIDGLSVVACGPIPANPSEILNSQGFLDLLDTLSKRYDMVVIDSPPVLPVTDARILAASVDGVLLALRAEKTTRSAATTARDQLTSVGGRVLGIVVNDVPRRRGVYSYYYADEGRYAYYRYGNIPRRDGNGSAVKSGNGSADESSAGVGA